MVVRPKYKSRFSAMPAIAPTAVATVAIAVKATHEWGQQTNK